MCQTVQPVILQQWRARVSRVRTINSFVGKLKLAWFVTIMVFTNSKYVLNVNFKDIKLLMTIFHSNQKMYFIYVTMRMLDQQLYQICGSIFSY